MTRDSFERRYYVTVFFFSASLLSLSLPNGFYGLMFSSWNAGIPTAAWNPTMLNESWENIMFTKHFSLPSIIYNHIKKCLNLTNAWNYFIKYSINNCNKIYTLLQLLQLLLFINCTHMYIVDSGKIKHFIICDSLYKNIIAILNTKY